MDTKQLVALERRQPHFFQHRKGLRNRTPFWEDYQGVSGEQLTMQLPSEFPKQPFHPISANCPPESLPHDNADPAGTHVSPANHHIEQRG
jgi:hypothetical protein